MTPDLAILLSEILFKQILAIGMRAKVKNIKLSLSDQSNKPFRMEMAKYRVQKEKLKATPKKENKAKQFAEEVKAELDASEPSGLMQQESK